MNHTTLNLLAVSVFGFTLLSLVGPLVHISPGAVAIALSGCAALVALDRFGWQGKGGNLVIDWLSGQNADYRQRIVHHEAGHFLAAYLLGIAVEGYTLSAWEGLKAGLPGLGGVVVTGPLEATPESSPESSPEAATSSESPTELLPEQWLNRYCIVWMAGIAAEANVYGTVEGGDNDRAQLRRHWQKLQRPESAETQLRWALLQAQTLLKTHQGAYEALVSAMSQRLSVEDCCRQIEGHLPKTAQSSVTTKSIAVN